MRNPRKPVLWLLFLLCGLASPGCVDPVREGVSGGVQQGIATLIATIFEDALDNANNGD
jgi:hypothetical protein